MLVAHEVILDRTATKSAMTSAEGKEAFIYLQGTRILVSPKNSRRSSSGPYPGRRGSLVLDIMLYSKPRRMCSSDTLHHPRPGCGRDPGIIGCPARSKSSAAAEAGLSWTRLSFVSVVQENDTIPPLPWQLDRPGEVHIHCPCWRLTWSAYASSKMLICHHRVYSNAKEDRVSRPHIATNRR